MDRADLLRWARDAGFMTGQMHCGDGTTGFDVVMPCVGTNCLIELQRFAKRVAEEEREACAKACEAWSADHAKADDCTYVDCDFVAAATDCATAIRKRGTP